MPACPEKSRTWPSRRRGPSRSATRKPAQKVAVLSGSTLAVLTALFAVLAAFASLTVDQGHETADHIYHHVQLPSLSASAIRDELIIRHQNG